MTVAATTMRACPQTPGVDAYFAGSLSPSRQAGLRAHLDDCEKCRARFARQQRLAELDPRALPFEERVGRALGLQPRFAGVARWLGAPVLVGVLAIGAVLLVGRSLLPGTGGFASRGPAEPRALILSTPGVEVLAFRTDQPSATLQSGQLPATAELAFAYRNRGGWPYLMVFARDESGNVYWYQPSWTDGRDDPRAVVLSSRPGLHELSHAVTHAFKGERLTLCVLASDRPLSVRQLEQQLPASPLPIAESLAAPGREVACRPLEVLP
jgi:hypothetical protein